MYSSLRFLSSHPTNTTYTHTHTTPLLNFMAIHVSEEINPWSVTSERIKRVEVPL